ncbi:hypothetical protein D9M72_394880 [compost metagenome]
MGTLTASQAATAAAAVTSSGRIFPVLRASRRIAPKTSRGYSLVAVPRPMKTPASTSRSREKKYMPTASRPTAHMSQLITPARMIPGATATIAASQGRRPLMRAVARTVTIHTAAMRVALTSK